MKGRIKIYKICPPKFPEMAIKDKERSNSQNNKAE